eukprot:TRINITY_DN5662_c0_g1_i4.p1 TRINITY_DN5662_c0_g1~~TRINITY_DN5662_c0_g1_i4.p1  ORF type:complete len:841 (-),score=190.43 TRINITY_DN5662_c0_g1_i4:2162-4432(-)
MEIDNTWYEKLQKWRKCLAVYEQQQALSPDNMDIMLGRTRCLQHLGYWEKLWGLTQEAFRIIKFNKAKISSPSLTKKEKSPTKAEEVETTDEEVDESGDLSEIDGCDLNSYHGEVRILVSEFSAFALKAALNLGKFEALSQYIKLLEDKTALGCFYHAIIHTNGGKYELAREFIHQARDLLAPELTALIGESYNRAYEVVVQAQQFTELEEIIQYKQELTNNNQERVELFHQLWNKRLQVIEYSVDTWQAILSVRSLVLPPVQNPQPWVKYANLIKKKNRFRRATSILVKLLGWSEEHSEDVTLKEIPLTCDASVHYAYLKLLSDLKTTHPLAYQSMLRWVNAFHLPEVGIKVDSVMRARCYAKLAHWELLAIVHQGGSLDETITAPIIEHCNLAIKNNTNWFKAWHIWAIIHYQILTHYSKQQENHPKIFLHLLPAITGFIRSIALAPSSQNLQDTLRLLTLWFTYGFKKDVEKAIREGFNVINVDTWLPVIPQIIARLHMRNIKAGIDQLLNNILQEHLQALVFPITVAHKSEMRVRKQSALTVMNNMKQHNSKLVSEALLVSNELIRISILWKEKWKKGLDEAYHQYYTERNIHGMMVILLPLHEMINSGATTPTEKSFLTAFGRDLEKAWNCCKDYAKSHNESCLHLAWDLYAHVFRILKRQLQSDFEKLHLSLISPLLESVSQLELGVPGTYIQTYKNKQPVIRIQSFSSVLKVISSKQRPRKLVIHGGDGKDHPFLLKGSSGINAEYGSL